jgi:hypothetical protein
MKYLTTPRGWRKKYYKFYWRLHYNMVRATIKKGKYSFMATQRHLSRFKNFMSHYEARINWLRKNRGHRSAQGRNKEAKLVRYGYKFQYLRTYRAGVGRCTIRDPRGTVLFYEITNAQVEQALNWLLRQAVIKGYTLQKARSPAAKIPFSYKQVLKQARQEYRSLSRIRKRARFKDFKKMLTLARLMDLQWETNYGLGGLGRAEDKIVRSLWAFHRRGHRGWKLIKYVWHQHMVDCWKVAAYNWAMRFGTGKYKLH